MLLSFMIFMAAMLSLVFFLVVFVLLLRSQFGAGEGDVPADDEEDTDDYDAHILDQLPLTAIHHVNGLSFENTLVCKSGQPIKMALIGKVDVPMTISTEFGMLFDKGIKTKTTALGEGKAALLLKINRASKKVITRGGFELTFQIGQNTITKWIGCINPKSACELCAMGTSVSGLLTATNNGTLPLVIFPGRFSRKEDIHIKTGGNDSYEYLNTDSGCILGTAVWHMTAMVTEYTYTYKDVKKSADELLIEL